MQVLPWMVLVSFAFFQVSSFAGVARIFGIEKPKTQLSSAPKIKVKVLKNQSRVEISGTDLERKIHQGDYPLEHFSGRKKISFDCTRLTASRFKVKPVLLASLGSPTGLVSLKNQKYQGDLHLVSNPRGKKCDVVQEVKVDDYISTLLSKEMNAKWPLEVLKAQAVAARSYAIHKMQTNQISKNSGFETYHHLENSEKYQVGGSFFDSTARTARASKETEGLVLTNNKGDVREVFFHARCGGRTLKPHHVWENRVKGYREVICPSCRLSHKGSFKKSLTRYRVQKFMKWLKKKGHISFHKSIQFRDFKMAPDKQFNRNVRFYFGDHLLVLKKSWFRKYFGRFDIPSNNFTLTSNKSFSRFYVKGKGNGHGVGMCQIGALDLAKKGWDYKRILSHYYPNFKLKKLY